MKAIISTICLTLLAASAFAAESVPRVPVDGQPLGANITRVIEALEYLGQPLDDDIARSLRAAARQRDAEALQEILDDHVLFVVSLNPEVRVKVARGPAPARLQQSGFTCHLVKVLNNSTVTRSLRIMSPQAGPVYAGAAEAILKRQAQTELKENENIDRASDRFLELEMFHAQPMSPQLSGLEVEYALAMIYCSESGKREATIGFDVGAGTQDIGFRGELPVLFDVQPARPIKLRIRDFDGTPTTARLTFRDKLGHVYPPQMKRLAPDFFFQPQIYRADGGTVLLPDVELEVTYNRGPEYKNITTTVARQDLTGDELSLRLQRWVNPMEFGFYCGDHHIHGAGCSHYDNPTQGVTPRDMFAQVKGEGLNVGCVLTWGPCFEYQRRYFSPIADTISEPTTILKYDLEISGFGSAALGHVCLLRLNDQTYPGSDGTKDRGWPTWTVPVMRWAKQQGGVTGYPHSAMHVNPGAAAQRMIRRYDRDQDQFLSHSETSNTLLPKPFAKTDIDGNGKLDLSELSQTINAAADEIPNWCVPEMNGAGAMEICVSTAEGVCDFISAMDTERIPEWNTWYHLLNCGFPLKLSGETDFPCMSSRRVGQGRVYVQLGDPQNFNFDNWCEGLRRGQSYVSDGFAHALNFSVNGQTPGNDDVSLDAPASVSIEAKVAFAAEQPNAVAYGGIMPSGGRRVVGDTRLLHAPRDSGIQRGGNRTVEVIVNGNVVDSREIPADGQIHDLKFGVPITQSSWVALRQFPQLHTNPVNVIVDQKPIRASRASARWCEETIHLLWKNRERFIAEDERPEARETYDRAIETYRKIAAETAW
ncbi:CehA/McbA family metallohydrolase [Stieleria sp. ICT_E10.1]|uniref:CehA/McbA family metallohydrolase n=1 Tax=Stieleria sedimenti TaxID=2976331 RepID=UPI00217FE1DC|nr:CehA/McbA family metallohydrolase [Stieleria sedimenti]MCS7468947.1 CehA/McbA family metallohydrolase [Stieleria sedimenti]